MRLLLVVSTLLLSASDAFQVTTTTPTQRLAPLRATSSSSSSSTSEAAAAPDSSSTKQPLGLLTFDLDDTLYPVNVVIAEANAAFVRAMNTFGFENIQNDDIDLTSKKIRQEISAKDPEAAAVLTHTELRLLAIRREMETVIFQKKLQATADDWATPVASLSPVVVSHAKKYVSREVFVLSPLASIIIECCVLILPFSLLTTLNKINNIQDGPRKLSLPPWSKPS
jgi:hypothetical protein